MTFLSQRRLPGVLLLSALLFAACDKKDPEPPAPVSAAVTLQFDHFVDGQPLAFGSKQYQTAEGNAFSVDMLKYYVTNVALLRADGTEFLLHNYDLVDAADPAASRITADSVPNGAYTGLRFLLGVDSTRNHTGVQDGDLDPVHGMIWTWNTGYIFFKHEGRFTNAAGADKSLVFHFGTELALTTIDIPFGTPLDVRGSARRVFLTFDLGRLYDSPNAIDFDTDNYRQSVNSADRPWVVDMRENFPGAFGFGRVE